jgi:hypothetical protein
MRQDGGFQDFYQANYGTSFDWVAAAADDRVFVLAAGQASSRCGTSFYELRLEAGSHPASVSLVPGTTAAAVYGLAVSADGSEFAVASVPVLPGSGRAAPSGSSG